MSTIYVLWLREVKRYSRSPIQIIVALCQPVLYLLALGFGLGHTFQKAGNGSYLQFVAPGIIGMTILFSSMFNGVALLWDRQFGFLKETLVAPVPRTHVMLGRILGGATVAVVQGILVTIVCLVAGFRPTSFLQIPIALFFMLAIAFVFAALGTAFGAILKNMQGFQVIMNFLMMPLFFLSGALFPLAHLPVVLSVLTHIDPLSYGIDGLRNALISEVYFGFTLDALVLSVTALLFLSLSTYCFSRIEV